MRELAHAPPPRPEVDGQHTAVRLLPGMPEPEKGEVLLRGVGTLRYFSILSEDSACQVSICAVAPGSATTTRPAGGRRRRAGRVNLKFGERIGNSSTSQFNTNIRCFIL